MLCVLLANWILLWGYLIAFRLWDLLFSNKTKNHIESCIFSVRITYPISKSKKAFTACNTDNNSNYHNTIKCEMHFQHNTSPTLVSKASLLLADSLTLFPIFTMFSPHLSPLLSLCETSKATRIFAPWIFQIKIILWFVNAKVSLLIGRKSCNIRYHGKLIRLIKIMLLKY